MYTSTVADEYALYAKKGVDGIFVEHLSAARNVWESMYPERKEIEF